MKERHYLRRTNAIISNIILILRIFHAYMIRLQLNQTTFFKQIIDTISRLYRGQRETLFDSYNIFLAITKFKISYDVKCKKKSD